MTLCITGWTNFIAVVSSADGHKLVAAAPDVIYTLQTTPKPELNFARLGSDLLLSWIVPSMPFVLQYNSDLATTNWTDVNAQATLNYTNVHYEVTLSAPKSPVFYRLVMRATGP